MSNVQKAYERGRRMGRYIVDRDGFERAKQRGSKADIVYDQRMHGLIGAYDRGYEEAVEEARLSDQTDKNEVVKAVILKMAERYREMYEELRGEYRAGKRDGWDEEALFDMRTDMHDLVTKEILLRELRDTLDERCSCYKNGIDYA